MGASAAIKAIEAGTVHQIQSGQVIVDLCSVAKELVENSVDAGATSIEVRFKNQGLDSIEVQDNGSGISPQNYESLALKHYTSKLSTYADLTTLQTFGFRGEALSSLCALSHFSVVTCLQSDVPKGTKLEFETSGNLKGTSVVAAQKGSTVFVEKLFHNLPVRRRELERNIKREWNKVISLLNQYACVQTGVKFTVSQQPTKGKRIVLFSTKGNQTTRENIVNVFGAKTMGALIPLDLKLELEPTGGPSQRPVTQEDNGNSTREIHVRGFVSRPAHGEGRQTPDRQMFYVNGRPCGLPQFAKVFNEVYRSYNVSQSPFIFADIQLDTHLYDVNVSPDKRTILLHEQGRMLDNLRETLVELFEIQDYTVPVAQLSGSKHTPFKKLPTLRQDTPGSDGSRAGKDVTDEGETPVPLNEEDDSDASCKAEQDRSSSNDRNKKAVAAKTVSRDANAGNLISNWVERRAKLREEPRSAGVNVSGEQPNENLAGTEGNNEPSEAVQDGPSVVDRDTAEVEIPKQGDQFHPQGASQRYRDFRSRLAGLPDTPDDDAPDVEQKDADNEEAAGDQDEMDEMPIPAISPAVRTEDPKLLRPTSRPPKRHAQEVATITIGDHTVTSVLTSPAKTKRLRLDDDSSSDSSPVRKAAPGKPAVPLPSFGGRLTQMFSASTSSQQLVSAELEVATKESEAAEPNGAVESDEVTDEDAETEVDENGQDDDEEEEEEDNSNQEYQSESEGELAEHQDTESESMSHASPTQTPDEEDIESAGDDMHGQEKETEDRSVREMSEFVQVGEAATIEEGEKRSQVFLKGGVKKKDSTLHCLQRVQTSEDSIRGLLKAWQEYYEESDRASGTAQGLTDGLEAADAEERLSLIISKADFDKMKIVGQFNLGFILAVRTAEPDLSGADGREQDDELFIIDQHASDEKYNFERLQASTVVQSQRLVHPKTLDLTAIEEEIILENKAALETNGFVVRVDESGDEPVGSRCELLSLPLSRETTFSLADLEELISLLGEHSSTSASNIPRPSKVRKMFAMRACRSSIMIGKALSQRQMEKVVRHMGEMEKPWNCPHGRPTMRHLCGLSAWDERGWTEGDDFEQEAAPTNWAAYVKGR